MTNEIEGSTARSENARLSIGAGAAVSLAILAGAWIGYDVMWKALAKQETAGAIVSLALVTGAAFGLSRIFVGRALYIHIGAIFGTIMAANVWMRIWPNHRRILHGVQSLRDGLWHRLGVGARALVGARAVTC